MKPSKPGTSQQDWSSSTSTLLCKHTQRCQQQGSAAARGMSRAAFSPAWRWSAGGCQSHGHGWPAPPVHAQANPPKLSTKVTSAEEVAWRRRGKRTGRFWALTGRAGLPKGLQQSRLPALQPLPLPLGACRGCTLPVQPRSAAGMQRAQYPDMQPGFKVGGSLLCCAVLCCT